MRKKTKTDYFDYWHVEMSFIATCNATRLTNEIPQKAVRDYIGLCSSTNRPNSARIAAENRTLLEKKYKQWSDKQNGVRTKRVRTAEIVEDDLEAAAIELLRERGYTISK